MRRVIMLTAAALLIVSRSTAGLELVEVVKQIEKSVVRIDTDSAFGSGVVIDDRGIVLTNYHVIEGARSVKVILRSSAVLEAHGYVAADPARDLALIKTDSFGKQLAIKRAHGLPGTGEKVAALGNPKGFSFTTSEGIVSAVRTGREISESVGRDAYRALGYAEDATWVQTTAPISNGNSGGPLVNMNAELVGLNTWTHTEGQNLNFAISAKDIDILLARRLDASTRMFSSLPKRRATAAPRESPSKEFKLNLPTGRVFSYDLFDVDPKVIAKAANSKEENTVIVNYPSGELYAAAGQDKGKLDGITIGQYENGNPMVFATYINGLRHGVLKTWSEEGNPVVFAQYARNKAHGLLAYHVSGKLVLVIQNVQDEPEWIQLMSGQTPLEGFSTRHQADKNPTAKEFLEELDEQALLLKKNEYAFKSKVRKFEKDRRRALASKLSVQKRASISARGKARSAANNAALHDLYRRAGIVK